VATRDGAGRVGVTGVGAAGASVQPGAVRFAIPASGVVGAAFAPRPASARAASSTSTRRCAVRRPTGRSARRCRRIGRRPDPDDRHEAQACDGGSATPPGGLRRGAGERRELSPSASSRMNRWLARCAPTAGPNDRSRRREPAAGAAETRPPVERGVVVAVGSMGGRRPRRTSPRTSGAPTPPASGRLAALRGGWKRARRWAADRSGVDGSSFRKSVPPGITECPRPENRSAP
jgi:hypothetical protein